MKSVFPEFYRVPEEEFKKIWDDCLFIFDANVLLHLYMYSQNTSQEFLKILNDTKIRDRVWMPHQFAFEYQRRRLRIISDQKRSYQKLMEEIEGIIKKFENHPFLKMKDVMEPAIKSIKDAKRRHPKWNEEDPICNSLTALFDGKIGKPFSKEELKEIYKEGQERFFKKIPPGYLDQNKDDEAKYGDLVGWKQILNYAKETSKPVIFVTDEKYDDWWWKINDEIIGTRYELVKEIKDHSGVFFCMYNSRLFHKQAAKYLKRKLNQNVAKEITEITEGGTKKDEINISPDQASLVSKEDFGTGEKIGNPTSGEPR
jgi:hypothetical protein